MLKKTVSTQYKFHNPEGVYFVSFETERSCSSI